LQGMLLTLVALTFSFLKDKPVLIAIECRFSNINLTDKAYLKRKDVISKKDLFEQDIEKHLQGGEFAGKSELGKLNLTWDDVIIVIAAYKNLSPNIYDKYNYRVRDLYILGRVLLAENYSPTLANLPRFVNAKKKRKETSTKQSSKKKVAKTSNKEGTQEKVSKKSEDEESFPLADTIFTLFEERSSMSVKGLWSHLATREKTMRTHYPKVSDLEAALQGAVTRGELSCEGTMYKRI